MTTESTLKACIVVVALAVVVFVPAVARAQSGSGIAGAVKDTTGAVLPGVTVEAASPVLIEKVRTVVTDQQGEYKILDLRPGTYAVTFTLPGFSTAKRDGIQLTTSFTAQVNAEMRVGAVEETVTVSGQSPVVDVQNTVRQAVVNHELLDNVPAQKSLQSLATLVVGVTIPPNVQDPGGTKGETTVGLSIHGSRGNDQEMQYDGMRYNTFEGTGGGSNSAITINMGTVQEMSLETSGISAESELGGMRFNVIPKEGGNTFKGSFFLNGANRHLQSDNLTDALRA